VPSRGWLPLILIFSISAIPNIDWNVIHNSRMFRFGGDAPPQNRSSNMLDRFLKTDSSQTSCLQRVLLGAVMLPHGAQKLLGWFGGYGFSGTMNYFTGTMHIPSALAFLVIVSEFFGSLGLLLGSGTRIAAFGAAATMTGAVLTTHLKVGFFMNWFGNQAGEGLEYHLLALALALPLVFRGGGAFSVDSRLFEALAAHRRRSRVRALSSEDTPRNVARHPG
jgi:putative oxidoreductase